MLPCSQRRASRRTSAGDFFWEDRGSGFLPDRRSGPRLRVHRHDYREAWAGPRGFVTLTVMMSLGRDHTLNVRLVGLPG